MRAMILAAGLGTRMRPLTDKTPKPLLKAGSHTLIEHSIFKLAQAGIRELVINHAWLGQQVEDFLGDGSKYQLSIQYSAEKEPLETAGGIRQALPLLTNSLTGTTVPQATGTQSDEPFLVVNGDIWADMDFTPLVNFKLAAYDQAHLVLVTNPEHHPYGDFVLGQDGRVQVRGTDKLTYSGIALFRPSLFAKVPKGVYPLAPVLRQAMQSQRVSGEQLQGEWFDIGTPDRLEWLDEHLTGA